MEQRLSYQTRAERDALMASMKAQGKVLVEVQDHDELTGEVNEDEQPITERRHYLVFADRPRPIEIDWRDEWRQATTIAEKLRIIARILDLED